MGGAWSRCGAASAVRTLQLGVACRLHLLAVVACVIARPCQRRRGDEEETFCPGDRSISVERLGSDELLDLRMTRRRLQILAHRQEIDAGGTHVVHHLVNLEPLLAEAD